MRSALPDVASRRGSWPAGAALLGLLLAGGCGGDRTARQGREARQGQPAEESEEDRYLKLVSQLRMSELGTGRVSEAERAAYCAGLADEQLRWAALFDGPNTSESDGLVIRRALLACLGSRLRKHLAALTMLGGGAHRRHRKEFHELRSRGDAWEALRASVQVCDPGLAGGSLAQFKESAVGAWKEAARRGADPRPLRYELERVTETAYPDDLQVLLRRGRPREPFEGWEWTVVTMRYCEKRWGIATNSLLTDW